MNELSCDIFCKVIDNYGDIGVCWRLARQLEREHGIGVRLWVDDLTSFSHLVPTIDPERETQTASRIKVRSWNDAAAEATPADIVIEAFACDPPQAYVEAMAAGARESGRRHAWINLEYLSAEAWVEDCHAVASPHPRLSLTRYFFFPGFTARTGGLLKEDWLDSQREAFQTDAQSQGEFWTKLGLPRPAEGALKISLFGYENAGLASLLDAWSAASRRIFCVLPEGRLKPAVEAWAGKTLAAGDTVERGALELHVARFMPQEDYDRLLWACDLNFVRGEDSFVRAQWARRPLVWHIYRQEGDVHRTKLEAFLARYDTTLCADVSEALHDCWHAWDREENMAAPWRAFEPTLPRLRQHAESWALQMADHGDLTSKLLIFCKNLLQ